MDRRSLAALGLTGLAAAALATPSLAQESKSMPRLISLNGHGEVKAKPDMAVVNVGVTTQAQTAREALTQNTAAMEKVFASLKASGIEAKDIQTSNFMINPRYQYDQNNAQPPRVIGYDVSNTVTVSVKKLDTLGAVLDKVVGEGSNQINGVMFAIADDEKFKDEARKLAVADAERKAKLYAETTRISLGQIMSLSEGNYQPPQPVYYGKAVRADAAPSAVPIAEGEQTVAIDVNIAWEIK
ncbi:SIMPL domain-containing protein [Taklimakanibacter deserti]|uniref:SIMPL domain-containing protein n=1 Tax=Taklimakanibacter deserti TaxID=2267839 RepID=UPI0013C42B30